MTLTPEQFRLVNRSTAPWLTLWLLADFEGGRSYAVGAAAGGTYPIGEATGFYETNGKGMSAWLDNRATPEVMVTWAEVGRWIASLPASVRETAAKLQREGREHQAAYPPAYPGIGRPYCWDSREAHTGPGCSQCARDRADLSAANDKRDREVEAWQAVGHEHDARVATFLASIAPSDEPADLLELLGVDA